MVKAIAKIKKLKKEKDIWLEVLGIWKNKKPDPLKYFKISKKFKKRMG
jgi:hypothetical protein